MIIHSPYGSVAAGLLALTHGMSCDSQSDRTISSPGSLIVAEGNRIARVDLGTRSVSILKDYGHRLVVDDVNALTPDTLVLDVCHVRTGCTIRALSLQTGVDTVLGAGWGVTIDATTRLAFFFDQSQEGATSLYAAPLSRLNDRRKVADVGRPGGPRARETVDPQARAVLLPTGRVVYVGSDRVLWSYDPKSNHRGTLGIRDCSPIVLRTRTGDLVCTNKLDKKWFLVNVVLGDKTELTSAAGAYSAVYEPGSDLLFLGITRGERPDIVELRLDSGAVRPIVEFQVLSTGVWVP